MTTGQGNEPAARKQQLAATFNGVADGYDAMLFTRRTADRLVELAQLQPGERVLDVATGTGWAALAAAKLVGNAGPVLGIDLAARTLDRARHKAATTGLGNVVFQVGDAERLTVPAGSVDVVLCASGIFFLPDPLGALREWRRVTRPGGRVAFSAFSVGMMGALNEIFSAHLQHAGLPPFPAPPFPPAGHWQNLLAGAGYREIAVSGEQLGYMLPDPDAWWREMRGGLHWVSLDTLSPPDLAAFRERYLAEVGDLVTDAGLWVDVPAVFALGVAP